MYFFYDHNHSIGTPIIIKSLPFQLAFHCILQAMNYTLQKKKLQKILTTQMSISRFNKLQTMRLYQLKKKLTNVLLVVASLVLLITPIVSVATASIHRLPFQQSHLSNILS